MFGEIDWDVELFSGKSGEDELTHRLTVDEMAAGEPAGSHSLPDDLETLAPGPFIYSILASVDPTRLTGYDLIRFVQSQDRIASHVNASLYEGIGEMAYAYEPDTTARDIAPGEFASEELQAALAKTRRAADADLGLALDLRDRMPEVANALRLGDLDIARVKVFSLELSTLDRRLIPGAVGEVLPDAPDLTTGQLRARLEKAVLAADPDGAEAMYRAGVEDRRVACYPNPDHTATIAISSIRPEEGLAATEHVHGIALGLKRQPGETRTLQQIMADVSVDLLRGNTVRGDLAPSPMVVVHLTNSEQTAQVAGYGPVLPASLTALLEASDGSPVGSDDGAACVHETRGRKPTTAQASHVRDDYPTCVFPGCRMPSERCDIDHRRPRHLGGKTRCSNLAPLCRRHHRCKDQTPWKLERDSEGSHTWTSPLGHVYRTRGPPGR